MKQILFILLLLSVGCSSEVNNSAEAEDRVTYFKDERTGICFAQVISSTHGGYKVTSITAVDCKNVSKLLK